MKWGALLAVALMFPAPAADAQQVIYGDLKKSKKVKVTAQKTKRSDQAGKADVYPQEVFNKTLEDALTAIARNWYPPKCNPGVKGPVIRMKLDMHGSVHEKYVVESSGVALMDESAMNAIEYQAPEFHVLREMYKEGAFDVIFDPSLRKPLCVTVRPLSAEAARLKPASQSGVGEGSGTSRITGKVVGARDHQPEEKQPDD
jgi:hypothetical protein